jgi:murein DD-endopeptidase MepM/ murein hydrolase activator NlpD
VTVWVRFLLRVSLVGAVFALSVAGPAGADDPADPAAVTPPAVDTAPAPAATDPAPAPLTSEETTAATTTTAAPEVIRTAAALVVPTPLRAGCLDFGAAALTAPGAEPVVVGPLGRVLPVRRLSEAGVAYPADGSVIAISQATLSATTCGKARSRGTADVRSLSLFGGAVTADEVSLSVSGATSGGSTSVSGLRVDGQPVSVAPGRRVPLDDWGYLVALGGPPASAGGSGGLTLSALVVHVVSPHAGLAAGTILRVPFARLTPPAPKAQPAATTTATTTTTATVETTTDEQPGPPPRGAAPWLVQRERTVTPQPGHKPLLHRPLTVTPPLGLTGYVFPVTGNAGFGDTYGGPRSDVAGGWHHGDDIFAPLGTPVIALNDGTLNRVGWQRLGGWRLWLRDRAGNQFYYAHLSGYTAAALRDKHVKAGQVIGFIGNTGDAFTTAPHLHFEVHPRPLLHLHYDGAVNPTSYLTGWRRVLHVRAPKPVHPRLPGARAAAAEAKLVFRELLQARGLVSHRGADRSLPVPLRPEPAMLVGVSQPAAPGFRSRLPAVVLISAFAAAALGALMWRWERRPGS